MTRKDKLREKFLNRASDANWTLSEVRALMSLYGFAERDPNGSSHFNFTKPGHPHIITIPSHGSSVKKHYIRMLREELT